MDMKLEVGRKSNIITISEPTNYPPTDNDTYMFIPKKSKKMKKEKHFNSLESSELFGFQSDSETNTNILLASVGGVIVVTGMILVVKNYCKKRSGYTLINNPEQRTLYGTMGNAYQGH